MARTKYLIGSALLLLATAAPCQAGMTADLAACTATDRPTSVKACTRVIESGRLPRNQFYIGYYNRGWSHRVAGDLPKALVDFDKAAALNPRYADTYYSRAVLHQDLGDRDAAIADLDRYLELKGDTWTTRFKRALLLRRLKEWDAALSDLDRAAAQKPDQAKIKTARALVLSDQGRQDAARAEVDRVFALPKPDAQAHYARALIAFRQKQVDPAQSDAEKALMLQKEFPAAAALLGQIAEERGDTATAAKRYKEALASKGKSIDGRFAYTEARERLAALTETKPAQPASLPAVAAAPANDVAVANPPPPVVAGEVEPQKELKPQLEAEPQQEAEPAKEVSAENRAACRRFIPAVGVTIAIDCLE